MVRDASAAAMYAGGRAGRALSTPLTTRAAPPDCIFVYLAHIRATSQHRSHADLQGADACACDRSSWPKYAAPPPRFNASLKLYVTACGWRDLFARLLTELPVRLCRAVGYALAPMVASGRMLGEDQPVVLHLLDIPYAAEALEGVRMELVDAAYPLVKGEFEQDLSVM